MGLAVAIAVGMMAAREVDLFSSTSEQEVKSMTQVRTATVTPRSLGEP